MYMVIPLTNFSEVYEEQNRAFKHFNFQWNKYFLCINKININRNFNFC